LQQLLPTGQQEGIKCSPQADIGNIQNLSCEEHYLSKQRLVFLFLDILPDLSFALAAFETSAGRPFYISKRSDAGLEGSFHIAFGDVFAFAEYIFF